MKVTTSDRSRHLVLRAERGEPLPDALRQALRTEAVTCGWLRGTGVLEEVQLRVHDVSIGAEGTTQSIAGHVQLVSLEGSVGIYQGDLSLGLSAVLARRVGGVVEHFAGEILSAKIVALEVVVAAFDDLVAPRTLDPYSGVWLLGEATASPIAAAPPPPPRSPLPPPPPAAWGEAIAASAAAPEPRPKAPVRPTTPQASVAMPQRPAKKSVVDDDSPFPEAGDFVEHFAFGACDVLKSDGDRLHLRLHKDGRIREIALEMLRVLPLETAVPDETRRSFRLNRKL